MKYNYIRRQTREVNIGGVKIGAGNPVAIQSMTNCNTNDTRACVEQCLDVAQAGGDIIRLTTQGVREAHNMGNIKSELLRRGCKIPVVADVHFNPSAALEAARWVDKVRINPGNFCRESGKIKDALRPLVDICKAGGVALRLGVNHGSLSERMMNAYGDTPRGMVESAMEYIRILEELDFHDIVISIKSSNTRVMISTVLLLAETLDKEGMNYPIHLGVTEAGDGEDGRVKSAVGIGTLLNLGIGDTIRVSLSEAPANEIPVACRLRDYISEREGDIVAEPQCDIVSGDAREYSLPVAGFENAQYPIAYGVDFHDLPADWHVMDASQGWQNINDDTPIVLSSRRKNRIGEIAAFIDGLNASGRRNPIIIRLAYDTPDLETLQIESASDFGTLLSLGYGSGIMLEAPHFQDTAPALSLSILQAARLRFTKTEYIACPGCGRTLFPLSEVLQKVREATSHLKGLKIGVMGCIVNGPGEMADADYGYVGAGPGRVSLYKGKQLILKNIPTEEALDKLILLIKENGDWHEP